MVIQAGGESRRMGQNKALVPFLGKPLIQRIYERVAAVADEVLVVTNQPAVFEFLPARLVADVIPGKGAMGGLYTAVYEAANPIVGIVATDMPFVHAGLLRAEIDLLEREQADVVIPASASSWVGLEPMHAVYRKDTCLPAIQRAIDADQRKLIIWFPEVKVRVMTEDEVRAVDPELRAFLNVNTPDELMDAEALARRTDQTAS